VKDVILSPKVVQPVRAYLGGVRKLSELLEEEHFGSYSPQDFILLEGNTTPVARILEFLEKVLDWHKGELLLIDRAGTANRAHVEELSLLLIGFEIAIRVCISQP
jgi:hypothetical protein